MERGSNGDCIRRSPIFWSNGNICALINPAVLRYRTIVYLSVNRKSVGERDIGTRGRSSRISYDCVRSLTSSGVSVFVKHAYLIKSAWRKGNGPIIDQNVADRNDDRDLIYRCINLEVIRSHRVGPRCSTPAPHDVYVPALNGNGDWVCLASRVPIKKERLEG